MSGEVKEMIKNMNPQVLAIYLPQFHRVPENDEWWGEGFTEWTAVRGAEPLFAGHDQPRVPLNKNYYDLLEHDTMVWQAELMKKYHVDGMCIYHYWFEDGRKILEKPAENLLQWTDIQMPFCFYWANQTWSRTWKKLRDSCTWSGVYEGKKKENETGILLKQSYGREKDWEEHFLYLLPFFKDERYIKVDNKPVFVIYRPDDIFSLWDMADYFNRRARQSGFDGIYFIGSCWDMQPGLDAIFEKQPDWKSDSYDEMWEMTLSNKQEKGCKTYFCGGVDFDNSPRMGKKSFIMKGAMPQKFNQYFKRLYLKSRFLGNEFIFVNAWNEWGEGMYLEPDETWGFGYLEAIKSVVEECREINPKTKNAEESFVVNYKTREELLFRKKIRNANRYGALLHNWLCLREHEVDFSQYFKKYGYHSIAIYGMGKLGTHLLYELKGSDVTVKCGIDKNGEQIDCDVAVYHPNHRIPEVDAVIITITDMYPEISGILRQQMNCPMVTIEEIIQELMFF